MPESTSEYDVVVIGAGPAGATCASLLAEGGVRTLLIERDRFPRFKIGESMMPATFSTLDRLGVLDEMRRSAFPRKHSVQFFAGDGRPSAPFYFSENDDSEGAVTWQVLRSEFDRLLADHARDRGAEVLYGTDVLSVRFDGERAVGVRVAAGPREGASGERPTREIGAQVVVDASGQSSLISRHLGLSEPDPLLRKASIYTHFEGAQRDPGIDEGATLILHTRDHKSWFWYIPLPANRVSVGVVGEVDHLLGQANGSPQEVFGRELALCPALLPRVANACQAMPMRVMRDFSYRSRQIAGDGWVLVGDALGFLDPIYSSGILLALKSGEFAADTIVGALAAGETSGARLGAFGPRFTAGMDALRSLVYAFYSPEFSFARFLKRYPQHRRDIVDLLTGEVFDRDHGPLFEAMAEIADLPGLPRRAAASAPELGR